MLMGRKGKIDVREREGELLECCDALALVKRMGSSVKVECLPLIEPMTVLAGKLRVCYSH